MKNLWSVTCVLSTFSLGVAGGLACGPKAECTAGHETCACATGGTCVPGLECLSGVCVNPGTADTGDDTVTASSIGMDSSGDVPPGPANSREVDILFVIDNSGSMGTKQALLVDAIGEFVAALDDAEADYRIGVTTTDNGNPWCGSTSPEAGQLVLSSCRSRTGQFVFNGNPPEDVTAIACTDICAEDSITVLPTSTALDPQARARPWIENSPSGSNVDGVGVVEALRCTMPQGIAGCGFESPLESAHKTLLRAANESEGAYGFVRNTAMLAIIIVTDEEDCSYNNAYQSIFLPEADGGNPAAFWSDPDASAPTSAVCWNAGVVCEGSGSPYDSCRASNKDVFGNIDVPDDDAVLHPIARYIDFLTEIEEAKKAQMPGQEVMVALIAGVPPGYAEGEEIVYADALDATEQGDFGIGSGCVLGDVTARPPARMRELIEAVGVGDRREAYTICNDEYVSALTSIANGIVSQLGE